MPPIQRRNGSVIAWIFQKINAWIMVSFSLVCIFCFIVGFVVIYFKYPSILHTIQPTPILYLDDASNYILKEEQMPGGYSIQEDSTGSVQGYNPTGFLSGYQISFENGNLIDLLEPTGYTVSAEILVYDNKNSARQEFYSQSNVISEENSKNGIKPAGSANIAYCDQSDLYLGTRFEGGLTIVQGIAVFQKENVVGVLTIMGTAGDPNVGIPIDVEKASNIRIKEIKYYGEIMTLKIK